MKKYLKWIICLISLFIFVLLGVLVLTKNDIYLDIAFYKFISKFINNNLTNVMKFLTHIGSSVVVISITLFTLIFFKNKKYGLYMAINLLSITLIQIITKSLFSRNRPVDINLIDETGYSFPSGHSLTSMAFYGLIIYFICNSKLNKKSKIIYTVLFSVLIFVTGLSRIYLGVHYFTDVLGGFTLAISYLIIYISLIEKKKILPHK